MADKLTPAVQFYKNILSQLNKNSLPYLVGGGLAMSEYVPIKRKIKDLDLFCKAGDYPKILNFLKSQGFKVRVLDERWLAQIIQGKHYADLIFSSPNYINVVDDNWFKNGRSGKLYGETITFVPPEEEIWCKAYVQDRTHFDGADINHLILYQAINLDWQRLLNHFELHWELFLSLIITFRFVYPSERDLIPKWLIEELLNRLSNQLNTPTPRDKICRGTLISRTQYLFDLENGFVSNT